MRITPNIRIQMEKDISACDSYAERNGSEKFYSELVARYVVLDPSFKEGLSISSKAVSIDSEFDFRPELHAIASKLRMYLLIEGDTTTKSGTHYKRKSLEQLLAEDIERCEAFLGNPDNEVAGQQLYIEITGRYDSVINGFGNGLYQYIADQHFYDPELDSETLLHNLRVLHGKMIAYQAVHFPELNDVKEIKAPMEFDAFISHANADKNEYVDQLKQSLDKLRIKIFYDKDTLEWGDLWKNRILECADKAEFGIIVISENFFGREWTERELNVFLNRQNANGQKTILPILHNISTTQLQKQYPSVADIQALDSTKLTCDEIALQFAGQLIKRYKKIR